MSTAIDVVDILRTAAMKVGVRAYLNIAPERAPGVDYIVFAFRSEVTAETFDAVNLHRAIETVDLIAYKAGTLRPKDDELARGKAALTTLQSVLYNLGPALSAVSGLETGATENGYHYARRRITINPHRAKEK